MVTFPLKKSNASCVFTSCWGLASLQMSWTIYLMRCFSKAKNECIANDRDGGPRNSLDWITFYHVLRNLRLDSADEQLQKSFHEAHALMQARDSDSDEPAPSPRCSVFVFPGFSWMWCACRLRISGFQNLKHDIATSGLEVHKIHRLPSVSSYIRNLRGDMGALLHLDRCWAEVDGAIVASSLAKPSTEESCTCSYGRTAIEGCEEARCSETGGAQISLAQSFYFAVAPGLIKLDSDWNASEMLQVETTPNNQCSFLVRL